MRFFCFVCQRGVFPQGQGVGGEGEKKHMFGLVLLYYQQNLVSPNSWETTLVILWNIRNLIRDLEIEVLIPIPIIYLYLSYLYLSVASMHFSVVTRHIKLIPTVSFSTGQKQGGVRIVGTYMGGLKFKSCTSTQIHTRIVSDRIRAR